MIQVQIQMIQTLPNWLSQWLTLKLLGFMGKIKFKLLFHGPLAE